MNILRRRTYLPALLATLFACPTFAQTTQPTAADVNLHAPVPSARVGWPDVVAQLADALADGNAEEIVMRLLPDDALIRRFDRTDYEDRLALRDAIAGLTVIATHGYLGVPNSIASDLAVDFRNSTRMPDELKDQMIPEDESAAKRANVAAGQWVTGALEPAKAQPIGMIVLLRRDAIAPGAAESLSLVFVLLKGESPAAGRFRITHVVFGDAQHIIRQ